jgi:hypothetical protein
MEERVARIQAVERGVTVDSVAQELQGIVVLCDEFVPNRETLNRVIFERDFQLSSFELRKGIENAQGGTGGDESLGRGDRDATPQPGYLGGIGYPPFGMPGRSPRPDPLPPDASQTLIAPVQVFQDASFNIQSAQNQCAEAADANVYRFLTSTTSNWTSGLFLGGYAEDPDLTDFDEESETYTSKSSFERYGPVFSLFGTPCPGCITGALDSYARREDVVDAEEGSGTSRCEHFRSLFGYLNARGDEAMFTDFVHAGSATTYGDGAICDDTVWPDTIGNLQSTPFPSPNGPEVGGQPRVTWDWIYTRLVEGQGVICTIGYFDDMDTDTRRRTGGHLVRIYGARRVGTEEFAQNWIYSLDDGNQGANNVGTRTTPWELEDLNGDDRFNVNGANTELEFCIAVKASPVPP